jgi:hypothetical protein
MKEVIEQIQEDLKKASIEQKAPLYTVLIQALTVEKQLNMMNKMF